MIWVIAYSVLVVSINAAFVHVPTIALPDGGVFPPLAFAVGLVFVARDIAQRHTGHFVLVAMAAGCLASYVLASPAIAIASAAAFAAAELADWAVYTWWPGSLACRVVVSSAISAPVDTTLFLWLAFGIGALSPISVALMVVAKLVAAIIAYVLLRSR